MFTFNKEKRKDKQVQRMAIEDARSGPDGRAFQVISQIDGMPPRDQMQAGDTYVQQRKAKVKFIEDTQADVGHLDDDLAAYPVKNPTLFWVFAIFLFLAEVLAWVGFLQEVGITGPSRISISFLGASGVFFMVWALHALLKKAQEEA